MGPSFENFREVVEAMRSADAIQIVAPQTFADSLIALMRDTEEARTLGGRGGCL